MGKISLKLCDEDIKIFTYSNPFIRFNCEAIILFIGYCPKGRDGGPFYNMLPLRLTR